jgi:hypothetical protein
VYPSFFVHARSELVKARQHLHSVLREIACHVLSYFLLTIALRQLMPASFSVHPDLGQEILVPISIED